MGSLKRFLPVALLALGCALLAISIIAGDASLSVFIIFPVFSGSGSLFFASVLLIMAGFLTVPLFFLGDLYELSSYEKNASILPEDRDGAKIRAGGVIFIGPIPILVASDGRTAFYTMLVAVIVLVVLLFLLL